MNPDDVVIRRNSAWEVTGVFLIKDLSHYMCEPDPNPNGFFVDNNRQLCLVPDARERARLKLMGWERACDTSGMIGRLVQEVGIWIEKDTPAYNELVETLEKIACQEDQ